MQLTLILLILVFTFPIIAMDKDNPAIDMSEWETIMVTGQDGVIIGSDPDSAGDLPFIGNSAEQSYYSIANIVAALKEPKEFVVTIYTSEKKLTNLILEDYPDKHPMPVTARNITLLLKQVKK